MLFYLVFWDGFNQVEAFDLESEVITKRIKELYFQSLNTQKAVHLNVIRAYKNHPVGQLTRFFGCFY
ncbi:MAG: hypothetical protein K0B11_22050 [Mariniphaga sp.]|nr:hypothetical protein [Mariniphaga sp.]